MFVLCRVLGGSRGHTARRSSAGEGEDGGRQSGRRAAGAHLEDEGASARRPDSSADAGAGPWSGK